MGEKALAPSVAALVLGIKSLDGKSVTEPLDVSNSTLDKSMAWISDRLRPLASKTRKKVLSVKSFREASDRGSKGAFVKVYKTKVTSQSGREGTFLGLCVLNDDISSDTTLIEDKSKPNACDTTGVSVAL